MLKVTQLIGFGSGSGGGTDVTPDAIDFNDISDSGFTASAGTNVVTISGIDTTITLRLTVTDQMTSQRTIAAYDGVNLIGFGNSGLTVDIVTTNGHSLQYVFTNSQNNTTWSGTATVTNVSDGGATLDSFAYTLQDTGSPVGVGVGVGGPIP